MQYKEGTAPSHFKILRGLVKARKRMTGKSDRVDRLLKDPDLQEAFDNVKRAIHEGWARTPPSDHDMLNEWHRRLFTLQSVEANLRQAVSDGRLEDFNEQEQGKPAPLGDLLWHKKKQQ